MNSFVDASVLELTPNEINVIEIYTGGESLWINNFLRERNLDQLNNKTDFTYTHRFWVRGHFRVLKDKKWKKSQGKKIWIVPFIKGEGVLIKKEYNVK